MTLHTRLLCVIGPAICVAALVLSIVVPALAQVVTCDNVTVVPVRHTRCFKLSRWNAEPGLRPCVTVTRIYEDGSFAYRTSDANGTERYTSGVGALDRCTGKCD